MANARSLTMGSLAMRHLWHNPRTKEQTNSFYLSDEFLRVLDFVAEIEAQSRSRILERALYFDKLGGENGDNTRHLWGKSKRVYKKAQKIHTKQRRNKADKTLKQSKAYKQECLFEI